MEPPSQPAEMSAPEETPIQLFESMKPIQKERRVSVERKLSQQLKLEKRILEEKPLAAGPKVELFNELKPVQTEAPLAVEQKFPEEIKLGKVLMKEKKRLSIDKSITPAPALQVEPPTPDERPQNEKGEEEQVQVQLFSGLKPIQKQIALAVEEKFPEEIKMGRIPVTEKRPSLSGPPGIAAELELHSELRPIQTEMKLAVEEKHPEEIKLGQIFVKEKRPSITETAVSQDNVVLYNELKPIQTESRLAVEEKHPQQIKLEKVIVKEKRLSLDACTQPIQLFSDLKPVHKEHRLSVDLKVPIDLKLGQIFLREKRLSQPNLDQIRLKQKRLSHCEPLQLYNELRPVLKQAPLAVEVKFPEEIRLGRIPLKQKKKRHSVAGPHLTEETTEHFSNLKPVQTERPLAVVEKYPEEIKLGELLLTEKSVKSKQDTAKSVQTKNTESEEPKTEMISAEHSVSPVLLQTTPPTPSSSPINRLADIEFGDEQMAELEYLKDFGQRICLFLLSMKLTLLFFLFFCHVLSFLYHKLCFVASPSSSSSLKPKKTN